MTDATVQGNSVKGGEVGIFLRDAVGARSTGNTISDVGNHAVTVIAATGATTVSNNTVSGRGPSAIDTARAGRPVAVVDNDTEGWQSTKPLDVVLRSIFQPLTILWISLGLIVLITAFTGLRRRGRHTIRHPYDSHRPLAAITAGVADPASFGRAASPSRPPRDEEAA